MPAYAAANARRTVMKKPAAKRSAAGFGNGESEHQASPGVASLPVASGVRLPLQAGKPLPGTGVSSTIIRFRATLSVVAAPDPEPFFVVIKTTWNLV
jgi:hypothetical protein